jgi:hypothetical protein
MSGSLVGREANITHVEQAVLHKNECKIVETVGRTVYSIVTHSL